VCSVIIAADGDPSGEAAAQAAAQRWEKEGRAVKVARPPAGLDFNDLLRRGRS
jgi:DNA primase